MEERNEYEVNELKKKFADIIDSSFQKLDADKKGYLNEQEFGNLIHFICLFLFLSNLVLI